MSECCKAFANALPAIVLILVLIWSYYVYVYEMCVLIIDDLVKKILYLIIFHCLFILFVTLYFISMFHKGWYVPDEYTFSNTFYERLQDTRTDAAENAMLLDFCKRYNLYVFTRTKSGKVRYCDECKLIKPDRAHHCSTCKACVIRMDHHCPWINNCVGFTNYKYFVVLVMYACLYCYYYCFTMLEYCIDFFRNIDEFTSRLRELNLLAGALITFVLGTTLVALFIFHLKLIFLNQTTLEAMYPPHFDSPYTVSFNKGRSENFYSICGYNCCLWFLPVNTLSGNGVDFDAVRQ